MDSGTLRTRPALPFVPAVAACCLVLCALFALDLWVTDAAVRGRSHALPSGLLPIATIQPGAAYLNDIDSRASMNVEAIDVFGDAPEVGPKTRSPPPPRCTGIALADGRLGECVGIADG